MSYVHPEDDPNWSYTEKGINVVSLRQSLERRNGRQARETIHRDSPIDGGVYEGTYGGEAIVVDSKKYPDGIESALSTVIEKVTKADGKVDKGLIFQAVYDIVDAAMRYDKDGVEDIFQQYAGGVDHTKIALNRYILDGVGVCRHQALFAGLLLEMLQKRGIINGRASIERNMVRNPNDDQYDGHSWVRYTNSGGQIWIIDVAQQRIGTLDELMLARENGNLSVWDYARPEDVEAFRARLALGQKSLQVPSQLYPEKSYTDSNGVIVKLPWS